MSAITLRPISASGTGWSNIANAYDNSISTYATVSTTSSNYNSRVATFVINASAIPSGSTFNSATLNVSAKGSSTSFSIIVAVILIPI